MFNNLVIIVLKVEEGIEFYKEGEPHLMRGGFNVFFENAHNFYRGRVFDVISSDEAVEHLENLDGFIGKLYATYANGLDPNGLNGHSNGYSFKTLEEVEML